MTKRMTKAQSATVGLFVIVCILGLGVERILDATGLVVPSLLCLAVVAALVIFKQYQKKIRIAYLRRKYADEAIVQSIMNHRFWIGQTSDQLVESIGIPHSMDNKMLKTKKREIWKYYHRGANRFGLRITLDEDSVTGWDQKS
jgi:hypothetical protein